jgi:glucose-6-phosphate 1-dehydrogenase
MKSDNNPLLSQPTIFFIFGGTGDLTSRKLIPALYNLFLDGWMPKNFAVIGMGRTLYSNEQFRALLLEDLNKFSRNGKAEKGQWEEFSSKVSFQVSDIKDDRTYETQSETIKKFAAEWNAEPCVIYYLAVAPRFFAPIAENLAKHKLAEDPKKSRIVIEKPFGHDLESAKALNKLLNDRFLES